MLGRTAVMCLVLLFLISSVLYADVVTDWNNVVLNTIRADGTPPPKASRALAMVHTAIFDAVNAIDQTCAVYHVSATALPGSSREAAAAEAAYQVMSSLYPNHVSTFNSALASSLSAVPDGAGKTNGVALGDYVGSQIVSWRSTDHSGDTVSFTPSIGPGQWQPTPPGYQPALLPNWPEVTPFGMADGAQFRGQGPPPLTSAEYAADFNETKDYGAKNSSIRSSDQTQMAIFWADGAGTVTPPGHWNQIAQSVATMKGNTISQNARLFACLNVAMADAAICAWDDKYAYNAWRPITAIAEADTDGNPLTGADPTWEPLLVTPPFSEYVSGHSTFSGAASRTLELFYGSDNISFDTTSDALPGVVRSFDSFSAAAYDAGRSRIYGGLHFEFSDGPAIAGGRMMADYDWEHNMQAVPEWPAWGLAVSVMGLVRFRRTTSQLLH